MAEDSVSEKIKSKPMDSEDVDNIYSRYALYMLNKETLAEDLTTNQNNSDSSSQDADISGLQMVTTSLTSEQENQLRVFLIRRLKKGAIYTGTGAFSGMEFSLSGSSPAVCYYILLPCHTLVCLLAAAEANLEAFRPELAQFCEELSQHIKDPNISDRLASWHVVCMQYVGRVLQALGAQVSSLLQLAQQNRGVKSSPLVEATLVDDVHRFLSVCAVAECLGPQPGVDAVLQPSGTLEGVECNAYCAEWGRLLLEHGNKAEPWRLRKVLEAFKLKTIKDMNMLKRLLKLAETDHYSLYRAYSFLWQSGNSNILLEQASLEGGSSPEVLAALQNHLKSVSPQGISV
ncbi:protein Njmu-R1 [Anabrus simplex]|uniref:protein Njmu-R1 n=1 Tax=Anabrus simplex TaxID=316456 RepID=UPI0035A2C099